MKAVLCGLLFLLSTSLYAQVQKGNYLLGGNLSFQSTQYSADESKTTKWNVNPNAGYFFIDKLVGGARVSFIQLEHEGDSFTDIMAGPFVRYYFLPVDRKTNLFLDAAYLFGSEKYDDFDAVGKTELGFAAGPAFFFNPSIAMEAVISWRSLKYKNADGKYNTLGIGVGLQIHFQCNKKKEGK